MILVKLLFEFEVLVLLYLLVDLLVPLARGRRMFPVARWIGRRLRLIKPDPRPSEDLVAKADSRLASAKDRLKAAEAEVVTAETEQQADNLEAQAASKRPKS